MHKTFDTPGPISLYVELGSGKIDVDAGDVTTTTVTVDGKNADDVTVEQRGNEIAVIAPKRGMGFFGSYDDLRVRVTMPSLSELGTKLGSADLAATGCLGASRIKSGSGDVRVDEVRGDTVVESGSGDIEIDAVDGALRVKSGSGDIEVTRVHGSAVISTGSGDVELGTARGHVEVKSGSGDLSVKEALADLALTTASGDLVVGAFHRGSLKAKNVSGDIHVGIPANIPVWTDISCVTGSVTSTLQGAGKPAEGQEFIELRANTVSGDIALEQL